MNSKESEPSPIDLDAPWCIGSEDFATFVDHVSEGMTVLELGSGASTLAFASEHPGIDLVSLESSPHFLKLTSAALEERSLSGPRLIHSPIVTKGWRGLLLTTYDDSPLGDGFGCDALLIDGPIERLFPSGREAALYRLFDHCRPGAVIGLDDYHRPSARTAVENWIDVYQGALVLLESTETFVMLRKVDECSRPRVSPRLRASLLMKETVGLGRRLRFGFKGSLKAKQQQKGAG